VHARRRELAPDGQNNAICDIELGPVLRAVLRVLLRVTTLGSGRRAALQCSECTALHTVYRTFAYSLATDRISHRVELMCSASCQLE